MTLEEELLEVGTIHEIKESNRKWINTCCCINIRTQKFKDICGFQQKEFKRKQRGGNWRIDHEEWSDTVMSGYSSQ